jgi:hypothetical protein
LLDQITGPIASVTADGAYDGEPVVYRAVSERQPDPPAAVIIPPRATAVPSPTADTAPTQRDRHLRMIRGSGRMGWQKAVDYGRRSLGETAVFRYKVIIGRRLRARSLPSQTQLSHHFGFGILKVAEFRHFAKSPLICGAKLS